MKKLNANQKEITPTVREGKIPIKESRKIKKNKNRSDLNFIEKIEPNEQKCLDCLFLFDDSECNKHPCFSSERVDKKSGHYELLT